MSPKKSIAQPTFSPKAADVTRDWWVVDAANLPLGRLASEIAKVLRGKHKPTFAPHVDVGDFVVVVNADQVAVTSGKSQEKIYYRHSGYPGGISSETFEALRRRRPEAIVERAVRGMLPKNRLGRAMGRKLKVYAGPEHPHAAQSPQPLSFDLRRQRPGHPQRQSPRGLLSEHGRTHAGAGAVHTHPDPGPV